MNEPPSIGDRKDEHVRYATEQHRRGFAGNDFDRVNFLHHALAGIDRADVDLTCEVAGMRWPAPLYINGMTGGSSRTGSINRRLAVAAAETGLPIGSGSMSAYLRDESVADTYLALRQENPRGIVMANVNAATPVDEVRRAVDLLEADAVQIHLNSVQEIVMPEGDRDFSGWPRQIEAVATRIDVPVIVKEVGFGLSAKTIALLRDLGVAVADVGGRGGTDFARIENKRRAGEDFDFLAGWGQSTPCCLLDAAPLHGIDIIASGGIRSALDTARALALGARATGVAGAFLTILLDRGPDALITAIRGWLGQLTSIMTVLGARTPQDLTRADLAITGDVAQFCRAMGIRPTAYSRRSVAPCTEQHAGPRSAAPPEYVATALDTPTGRR
ncbi:type 2 isopentenyl-diphosphate Delta-isomerase [Nocardia grenadensis]|uniref:type 2 isopentenyl-diphosphate Delta-isomerase n=1 Tax=Nocardia grenadensis TaxID=931537 RepID=UPI000A01B694|nr:type 2 isopentenyl-diphosphate Delta-isomerase [Nocardia grenadensis]